jgi:hypothetical protein
LTGVTLPGSGGWSGGTNDISSNPGFVSTTDYHLPASSTATGMGLHRSRVDASDLKANGHKSYNVSPRRPEVLIRKKVANNASQP